MPIQFNLARCVFTTPRHEMTEGLGSSSALVTDASTSAPQELDPVVLSPEAIAALKSITPVPLEERLRSEDPKIQKILDKIYENDPKVSELDISSRGITDDQLILILEALKTNTHITSLNLLGNKIGDEGAAALAENITITKLNLCGNNIGAEGAIALAQNSTIITLNLRENKIGDEGARALAQNSTIIDLNLLSNCIGDEGAAAFARNNTITKLSLSCNNIGAEGAI